jgi:ComF family protein
MDRLLLKKLEERLHGEVVFTHALAYYKFYKSGLTQRLLHHMKYRDRPDLAMLAGRWFGGEIAAHFSGEVFDMIVPVPLHRKKERKRGYNQSVYLARGIAESTGIPVQDVLLRTKYSDTQTHKSRIERWQNVSGIFQLRDPQRITGKHVLLVDDVVTTGATLESCGCTIMNGGAVCVSAAALAMAM